MSDGARKRSYTVPVASDFRDRVVDLARRRRVNVADIARSILIALPRDAVRAVPDPGGPPPGDREAAVHKSGPGAGRAWRRKPRLQVRLAPGFEPSIIRRAFALALAIEDGGFAVEVVRPARVQRARDDEVASLEARLAARDTEAERLKSMVSTLSFTPLAGGVRTRSEALHILGFAPTTRPERAQVRERFRTLASIYHPDSPLGSHQRMSQLNAAMDVLARYLP